ncbi:MAG: glycine cleavage system aminomethyltransferase GcvT [Candidatus Melainabacteria bacterium]|nr:glycine cleavage system aminomethyltransferase GcvT [Candidatus Melainabacteria bacterium]
MTTAQLRETPLAATHRRFGARMVDFAGWNMPVQYKSIIAEHMAVRTRIGIFDVSHMGEFVVKGSGAHDFVQYVIANDLGRLKAPNAALYTQFVNQYGGTVDDLIVYRRNDDYLMVVNASNIEKDWKWLAEHAKNLHDVVLDDISDATGLIALQGPESVKLMGKLGGSQADKLPAFGYGEGTVGGVAVSFGRTGYTGEDGFEIFVKAKDADKLWNVLIENGQDLGIEPCGLGARDTLRLEAGMPLYGHELNDHTSPLEAGLGWSVRLDKEDFIGREALLRQKGEGLSRVCVCLKVDSKALPRQGYAIYAYGKKIGEVASGSQGIFVGYPIAMGFVPPAYSEIGQELSVEIRGTQMPAVVVKRPFYKRQS